MPWYVLCTKPRKEKFLAKLLAEKQIEVYCPLIRRKRRWSDRIKTVEEPLFPCYCFVNVKESERADVFVTPGIVRYLYWLGKPAIVKDKEIDLIKLTLNQFDHDLIHLESFNPKDKVVINSGSFMGQGGTVVNQQGIKVLIHLDSLQLCIRVDTSKTLIAKE
ncbi:UpxY family transcription antiterminator [Spirosoma linguale]|uniref:NusG antitermination factor n=1 Tax=Spirosoma linguale (strain ATCC 33905 / DSM 74 / LMG 10896 / Claus 1) TaxID=504472 RepID=D2QI92_SPILD|nr:NusG antitermination factor [Spirosoma linguale DSM 74]